MIFEVFSNLYGSLILAFSGWKQNFYNSLLEECEYRVAAQLYLHLIKLL